MQPVYFTLFDTALGTCGIAWGDSGLTGCHLPAPDPANILKRLIGNAANAHEVDHPPTAVMHAIMQVKRLITGDSADFSAVQLDMRGVAPFTRGIYALVKNIPRGSTLTYGEVAAQLGQPGAARAIGQAMATNPFAPIVPCHRVLAAGNKPGGFTAHGGVLTKMKLLQMEGALPDDLLGW